MITLFLGTKTRSDMTCSSGLNWISVRTGRILGFFCRSNHTRRLCCIWPCYLNAAALTGALSADSSPVWRRIDQWNACSNRTCVYQALSATLRGCQLERKCIHYAQAKRAQFTVGSCGQARGEGGRGRATRTMVPGSTVQIFCQFNRCRFYDKLCLEICFFFALENGTNFTCVVYLCIDLWTTNCRLSNFSAVYVWP